MIKTFSPGIAWYAEQVRSGTPFSIVRMSDLLRNACPYVPSKYVPGHKNLGAEIFRIWAQPEGVNMCREVVLGTHEHPRYWPAIWHQDNLRRRGELGRIEKWLEENKLLGLTWHDGGVWKEAVERGEFYIMIKTLKEQKLPVILFGPERIQPAADKLDAKLVSVPFPAPPSRASIGWSAHLRDPCIALFSISILGKAAIQHLFPIIGHHSFLIDCGSIWDALCGHKERPYQKTLTPELIERNWGNDV